MKIVIFGLSISSSWGNGHATLWRGLCKALAARGHRIVFFERDVPYYAAYRDLEALPFGELVLYPRWDEAAVRLARRHLKEADVAVCTSYCPDAVAAAALLGDFDTLRVFYDLDTPVTLRRFRAGEEVDYLGPALLSPYDLVLSYTGGRALDALCGELHARRAAPLYGSVDPDVHRPVQAAYSADLSYLGTYSGERQAALESLFVEPASARPQRRFVMAGAQYPANFPWKPNIYFLHHLPPPDHAAFFCGSRFTLNVTRPTMARMGYCPSGRLFEAAACGVPIVTDEWEGLGDFLEPGREVIAARGAGDVIAALELSETERDALARAARERVLEQHTSTRRAAELEALLAAAPAAQPRVESRCGA